MKIILRIIQVIIIILPVIFLIWLFNLNFVPSGTLEKTFDFSAPSPYADYLVPQQRVTGVMKDDGPTSLLPSLKLWKTGKLRGAGESFQQIIEDPVYFHTHLPSSFDSLTVGIKFKPDKQPLLEYGPLITEEAWQYDLRGMWNQVLEEIDWFVHEYGGPAYAPDTELRQGRLKLYQRRNKFSSVQEFLDNLPDMDEVGVYDYSLNTNYQIPDYVAQTEIKEYEIYLRGYHQFLTYLGDNEALDFSFWIQDMNRGEGADPVVINLYKDNVAIDSKIIPDGELWRDAHDGSTVRRIDFKRDFLTAGVYKIELKVPTDIFIRRIATPQQKLVIVNSAFLGDEVGYSEHELPIELWTNSNYVVAETFHADGTQALEVNDSVLKISESHREFYNEFVISPELNRIYSPQGDIKLVGNGLLAWNKDLYFNPYPKKLDANSDLDGQGINYVLTNYEKAEKKGDWYYQEQEFDLERVPAPGGTIKFSISAPGVGRRQAVPAISKINLTFQREALTLGNWYDVLRIYFSKALGSIF